MPECKVEPLILLFNNESDLARENIPLQLASRFETDSRLLAVGTGRDPNPTADGLSYPFKQRCQLERLELSVAKND